MVFQKYLILLIVTTSAYGAPASLTTDQKQAAPVLKVKNDINNDLKTASSSYSHQYSDWGGRSPGGYGYSITGFGTIDDKYTADPLYKGFNGYDNSLKYNSYGSDGNIGYSGYKGSDGFGPSRFGPTAIEGNLYGNEGIGYGGSGYGLSGSPVGIGSTGNGIGGYGGNSYGGYGGSGYGSYGGGHGGYGGGNGGYGGYGGNGGLNSYYGYNNPNYQGGGHLGYGYQAKKIGYGNIYSSGITPSLVTGYRGYTRR